MKPITIAVAGKGGVGKTTVCGMLIRFLCQAGKQPILVVDADPNANLNEVLGVQAPTSLGEIRETMARSEKVGAAIPGGMSKQEYTEYMFSAALAEEDAFDMLLMGRTQGKGCYCFVNGLLKTQIDKYAANYRYVVVDNEAGLEHISRGILPHIDILLLIADSSRRGVQAAGRIAAMTQELELNPKVMKLIVNRAPDGVADAGVLAEIAVQGLDLLGVLPDDQTIYRCDCQGLPTADVAADNPVKLALAKMLAQLEL